MIHTLQPLPAILHSTTPLTADDHLFLFHLEEPVSVAPGQFIEISIPGIGGFPVSPCDLVSGTQIYSCIRRAGRVTSALFSLETGAPIGIRGPFGNGFDLKQFDDRDVLLMAGGLGIAPLRALIATLLRTRRHRQLILLFGAKNFTSLLFHDEWARLAESRLIQLFLTVDDDQGIDNMTSPVPCRVGLVTSLLEELALRSEATTAVVSGPPIMYRHSLEKLATLGLPPGRIFATLERRMRCGVGECCHCVTGGVYLCQDGPVFSLEDIRTMEGAL